MKDISPGLSEACIAAGELVLDHFGRKPAAAPKGGRELVTKADLESEELLRRRLAEILPGVPVIGEEGGDSMCGPPFWLVDPLDGTTNFAHGFPVFSISVALVGAAGIELGCVRDPLRGETFHARRGGGAYLDGRRIRCSAVQRLDDALLATGFPYTRTPGDLGFDISPLVYFLGRARGIRRSGSAALDLAYVACGRLDGFWEEHLRPWDMAAGALLVAEAGGKIEAFDGSPWTPSSGGVAAAGEFLMPSIRAGLGMRSGS